LRVIKTCPCPSAPLPLCPSNLLASFHPRFATASTNMSESEHSDASKNSNSGSLGDERAPLTKQEIKIVTAMRAALKKTDSAYCFSGHVPAEVKRPAMFYATTPATFATEWTKVETAISTGYPITYLFFRFLTYSFSVYSISPTRKQITMHSTTPAFQRSQVIEKRSSTMRPYDSHEISVPKHSA
jgi:hypothetical protein